MAIVKRGKIRGKAGNVVYRYSQGQEIIQSAPRKGVKSKITKQQNKNFAACSQLNQQLHFMFKAMALNIVDPRLYNRVMKLLMRNFFSDRGITESDKYLDWKRIPKSKNFPLHKGKRIENILQSKAKVKINDRLCTLTIPGFYPYVTEKDVDREIERGAYISLARFTHPGKNTNNIPKGAKYVSFTYFAFLLNVDNEVELLYQEESEQKRIDECSEEREVSFEIKYGDEYPDKGLLCIVIGLKFFTFFNAPGYLNNHLYNPCSLLGIWYKR